MQPKLKVKTLSVPTDFAPDWDALPEEAFTDLEEEDREKHRARISEPIDWYKMLIEASNHVYIVEHGLRVSAMFNVSK